MNEEGKQVNEKKFNKISKSIEGFCTQDIRNLANEKIILGRQVVTLFMTFLMLGITGVLFRVLADGQSVPKEAINMMIKLSTGIILPVGFFAIYFVVSAINIYKYLYLKESEVSK